MAEIIPAIIPKSFRHLEGEVEKVKGLCDFVHIDITDGKFGEGGVSWPFENDRGEFRDILSEKKGLPNWEELDYEVHLMVREPLSYVNDWIKAGASRIIVHIESLDYENDIQLLDKIKSDGLVEFGIAINTDTEIEKIKDYLHIVDFVHCMTISAVGAQGLPFDAQGIENVRILKQDYPEIIISVDGAMDPERTSASLDAGASRIIVGSYIFKSTNPRESLRELQELV